MSKRRKLIRPYLKYAFSVPQMKRVWHKTVRQGMRRQSIQDLHDYMDVHRNLTDLLRRARTSIVSGDYQPRVPEVVLEEKGLGISRKLSILNPVDALVLQTAIEVLHPRVKRHQPSGNAYYSRSHSFPKVQDFKGSFGYPWWFQWPEFQKKIWGFSASFSYTVVTDIADFFDSISLSLLRNVVSSFGKFEQQFLDFLFYLLEAFVVSPSYMPSRTVGLPQINFDAPRLLAHSFLFEADKLLKEETGDNFVRWMDDINFGVQSEADAKRILGKLHALLGQYGLRLNAKKTQLFDAKGAAAHFWIKQNTELNVVENGLELGLKSVVIHQFRKSVLRHLFDRFSTLPPTGNWDKVYKRFLTLFGKLGDDYLESQIPDLLMKHPSLREPAMRYYLHLGFTGTRYKHIQGYLEGGHCIDDVSVFAAAKLIVDWKIPYNSAYRPEANRLATELIRPFSPFRFTSGLWILAKYASPRKLGTYIVESATSWRKSGWAGRQVAAVWPLVSSKRQAEIESILSSNGLLQGLQVLAHIRQLYRLNTIDEYLESYLTSPSTYPYNYSLQKCIMAVIMLSGELNKTTKKKLWSKIKRAVGDPVYLHKLSSRKPS